MTAPLRVIPRLDIKGENVVKGVQMEGLRVIGNPNKLAREYYDAGADELIFIDTVASLYGRNQILSVVKQAAHEIFVPLTVGGGIRSLEDINAVLRNGADKVAINTAAVRRPEFIQEASKAFGSECIVLSVEAKKQDDGHWEAYTDNGRERTGKNVLDWVIEAEDLGAGEIFLTSVDRDGTRSGFDCELSAKIHQRVRIPVITSGGAGDPKQITELLESVKPDAICCGSIFHYGICPLPELKSYLSGAGHKVRE